MSGKRSDGRAAGVRGKAGRALERVRRAFRCSLKTLRGKPLRILCESSWRLGDELMMFPCYEALKRRYPGCRLAVKSNYPELVVLDGHVDEVNPPIETCDLYIKLSGGAGPGVKRREVLQKRIGAPLTARTKLPEPDMRLLPRALKRKTGIRIALFHASSQPCKRWPRERFKEIALRLLTLPELEIVEVGKGTAPIGVGVNLIEQTTLPELAAVLRSADLYIGNDSGPLHLALAVGTPAVGIFGSTDPGLLFEPQEELFPVVSRAECRGCWSRETLAYPLGECPRESLLCMEAVTVDDVWPAVELALRHPRSGEEQKGGLLSHDGC